MEVTEFRKVRQVLSDFDKAFYASDIVTFREGDLSGIEFVVKGYDEEGRVKLEKKLMNKVEDPEYHQTVSQDRVKIVKNGISVQRDELVRITNPEKIKANLSEHYIKHTEYLKVLKIRPDDGSVILGNPDNKNGCIIIFNWQLNLLKIVGQRKLQIRKRHSLNDTSITLYLPYKYLKLDRKKQKIEYCMKNIIPKTNCWKDIKGILINRLVITKDLRNNPNNLYEGKFDYALIGDTQLEKNFIGFNRPLEVFDEFKIEYDDCGEPIILDNLPIATEVQLIDNYENSENSENSANSENSNNNLLCILIAKFWNF